MRKTNCYKSSRWWWLSSNYRCRLRWLQTRLSRGSPHPVTPCHTGTLPLPPPCLHLHPHDYPDTHKS